MTKFKERIVKKGHWFYDGTIKKGIIIKAVNYDFWYETEKDEGLDMEGEEPNLNENGEMYIINWTNADFSKSESFTVGKLDFNSTVEVAELAINQKIKWLD